MTPDPPKQAIPPVEAAKPTTSFAPRQVFWFALGIVGVIVVLTLVLAFHYPKSSDTTSVLGVAIPALTAIIGVVLGGGAGNVVGSAGKSAIQTDLTRANAVLSSAGAEVQTLSNQVSQLFGGLKQNLASPAGESRLLLGSTTTTSADAPGINIMDLDAVSAGLERLRTLCEIPQTAEATGASPTGPKR
jgi:hypothetical protein